MDLYDAEQAVDLINDYWPGTLEKAQIESWARVVLQSGGDFDTACQWIADHAANSPYPPRLNELCTAIRPQPEPIAYEDTGPPVSRTRGQAWAAHTSGIGRLAAARKEQHNHKHGAESCPICTQPGTYTQCGHAACPICAA